MSEVLKAWETISKEYHTDWRNIRNLCDNVYFGRNGEFPSVSPSLTDDQQVVLEWLKKKTDSYPDVGYLVGSLNYFAATPVGQAWKRLSKAEQFQVLAAFAEWGMANECCLVRYSLNFRS